MLYIDKIQDLHIILTTWMKIFKITSSKKRLGIKSLEAQGLTNETLQLRTPPPRASFHTRRGGPLRTPWHPIADRGRLPPFNLGRGSRPRHRILLPPGLGVESWNDPPWSWVMSRQLSKELEPLEKNSWLNFPKAPNPLDLIRFLMLVSGFWERGPPHYSVPHFRW